MSYTKKSKYVAEVFKYRLCPTVVFGLCLNAPRNEQRKRLAMSNMETEGSCLEEV